MLLPGVCREVENEAMPRSSGRGESKEINCKTYILLKSCNQIRGEQFSLNVSRAQMFLVAQTYKLCYTAFRATPLVMTTQQI